MIAALVILVAIGTVTRKARVIGVIVPVQGSATISATTSGVLKKVLVREGQTVEAGQRLFELSTERQSAEGELGALISYQLSLRKASLESEQRLHKDQHQERVQRIREREKNIAIQYSNWHQEISVARRRKDLSEMSLSRFEALQKDGFVSHVQVQQKQEELLDLTAKINSLERGRLQADSTRLELKSELEATQSSFVDDLAQIDRTLAILQQEIAENQNRHSNFLIAPQAGMITTIAYQPGQTISAGQMLATLLPVEATLYRQAENAELEAHLYAPSSAIGFIETGQKVAIRYDAFPYQKFGLQQGTVINVSHTPFSPSELPAHLASTLTGLRPSNSTTPAFSSEALFRIKVRLEKSTINTYGKNRQIRTGMTINADLRQDQRQIWEWIAEPLLATTKSD